MFDLMISHALGAKGTGHARKLLRTEHQPMPPA